MATQQPSWLDEPRRRHRREYMRSYRRGIRRPVEKRSAVLRMLEKLDRDPGELIVPTLGPCWVWRGARNADGYGVIRGDDGRLVLVHRLALELALERPLADGMWACHRCDYPRCARPSHLYEGTPSDNAQDTWDRGRRSAGEAVA